MWLIMRRQMLNFAYQLTAAGDFLVFRLLCGAWLCHVA